MAFGRIILMQRTVVQHTQYRQVLTVCQMFPLFSFLSLVYAGVHKQAILHYNAAHYIFMV